MRNELLNELKLEDLQGEARELAETIGMDAFRRLVDVYGGTGRVYIPQADKLLIPIRDRLIREPSRVLFHADGTWHVLDGPLAAFAGCPVRMERRQRRAYVTAELGGVARRVRFGVIPVDGDAQ